MMKPIWNRVLLLCGAGLMLSAAALQAEEKKEAAESGYSCRQCEEIALKQNASIKAVESNRGVSQGKILQSYSEALPTVGVNYTRGYADTYAEKATNSRRDRWDDSYVTTFTVKQPLFKGGRIRSALRSARLYRKDVEENIDRAHQRLRYQVRVQYYQALLALELVRVAAHQVSLANENLVNMKKRKAAGVATDYDVLRAEVEHTNEKTALVKAKNDRDQSFNALSRVVGLSQSSSLKLSERLSFNDLKIPAEELALGEALASRPDLNSADINVKLKKHEVNATRANLLPQVNLTGSYKATADDFNAGSSAHDKDWFVGLEVDLTLFDGLLYRGQIREKRAQQAALSHQYSDLREQIHLEVRNALRSLKSAREAVLGQQKNVEQAKESLRLIVARETAGVVTHLDVLTARQTLAISENNYYQSIFAHKVAEAELNLAIGKSAD